VFLLVFILLVAVPRKILLLFPINIDREDPLSQGRPTFIVAVNPILGPVIGQLMFT